MSDSYNIRNDILASLHNHANNWLGFALARAPMELQATLQVSGSFIGVCHRLIRFSEIFGFQPTECVGTIDRARRFRRVAVRSSYRAIGEEAW